MTEKAKRDRGLWYDANNDPELIAERAAADELAFALNQTHPSDVAARERILSELLGSLGPGATILSPFTCDYGYHISIGAGSFLNHGAYLMDCAPITIGANVFIGPDCGLYTAAHPLLAEERRTGAERALLIRIEDDVWLGGGVRVMPGVTIGAGSVVGAGSLVTRDIPAGVIALGSPARPVRAITEADRVLGA